MTFCILYHTLLYCTLLYFTVLYSTERLFTYSVLQYLLCVLTEITAVTVGAVIALHSTHYTVLYRVHTS